MDLGAVVTLCNKRLSGILFTIKIHQRQSCDFTLCLLFHGNPFQCWIS